MTEELVEVTSPRREFRLPGIEELTKEQEAVLALPREGRHLIVGGPGTGKTVVCLLRARRLARVDASYRFLVWNHLLRKLSNALFKGNLHGDTWESWFPRVFKWCVGEEIPRVDASRGVGPIDWSVANELGKDARLLTEVHPQPLFLVIDEGQDMPPDFYFLLAQFGFKNFFVAMDQNQQIGDLNCSRKKLTASLALLPNEVHELTRNHRNSYLIARLAQTFCTDDPASPPPDLPSRLPSARSFDEVATPVLYRYRNLATVASGILEHWDQDPRRLIGVISPNNAVRKRYLDHLRAAARPTRLDNAQPRIETFYGDYRPEIRFDRGGVLVINAQACKGQEFDSVYLADIDEHIDFDDPDHTKKRFYVMASRAKSHLTLLMKHPGKPWIEKILTNDQAILRREEM